MKNDGPKLDLGDKPDVIAGPSGWEYLAEGGVIRCAFSTVKKVKMGMSANTGKREVQMLWYVEQVEGDRFEARKINPHKVPAGEPELIPMHRLVNEFTPQIAYYEEEVYPAMQALEASLDEGDDLRAEGKLYSAEMEYSRALAVEEHNVRALFGLGLIFAGRKEMERTRSVLGELINVQSAFVGKNQHLFNEFGIALRKIGLFQEAVAYYDRALEFVQDDENLYYNLARSHYENNDWEQCVAALLKSNLLNPELKVTRNLFKMIIGLAENENMLAKYGKPPVPEKVLERAKMALTTKAPVTRLDEAPVNPGEIKRARYGGQAQEQDNYRHEVDELFGDLDD